MTDIKRIEQTQKDALLILGVRHNQDTLMNNIKLKVVQCWDDGVTTDERLIQILRRHGAKATFNLNAGLHDENRKPGWTYKGTQVSRLGWSEMREIYEGFTIANHSLTHPHLEQIPIADACREIKEGRDRLQQFFEQEVLGFAYPFGTYNDAVEVAVRDAGHLYARTTLNVDQSFPPASSTALHPNCHFRASDLWEKYHKARFGGVFYFWGHSYEMINDAMWDEFDETIERISNDPAAQWCHVEDLFKKSERNQSGSNKSLNSDGENAAS